MEEQKRVIYDIDYDLLNELEKEDEDSKNAYKIINKELLKQEELHKIEEEKKNLTNADDFKMESLEDIISSEEHKNEVKK